MIQLVVDLVIGGGFLAVVYRVYLAISAGKEKLVEIKNDVKVSQDEAKDAKDRKAADKAGDDFNRAVDKFNSDQS